VFAAIAECSGGEHGVRSSGGPFQEDQL